MTTASDDSSRLRAGRRSMLATACRRLALARVPAPCPSHRVLAAPSTATSARAVVVMAGGRKRAHVKIEVDDAGDDEDAKATTPKARRRRRRRRRRRSRLAGGLARGPAPRSSSHARGRAARRWTPWAARRSRRTPRRTTRGRRFVTLVSAMLSSQTKDPITHAATARLVKRTGARRRRSRRTSAEELDALIIRPVGFHASAKRGYLRDAASGDLRGAARRRTSRASVDGADGAAGGGPEDGVPGHERRVGRKPRAGYAWTCTCIRIAERIRAGCRPVAYSRSNGTPRKNADAGGHAGVRWRAWLPEGGVGGDQPPAGGPRAADVRAAARRSAGSALANALCPSAFKDEEARRATKEAKNAAAEAQG